MVAMAAQAATGEAAMMRAAVRDRYGSPDILRIDEVEKPPLADDGVLVRVRAVSVNRGDWYMLAGRPAFARPMMGGIFKPASRQLGSDFAGIVEAVGKDATGLAPGDEVFGARTGSFAEYVCARVACVTKPANVSFEEAAAVPVAALTALQGLRDHGKLQAGQRVLINGASGGVGTFAVQIAKALGAHVTAVCSTRNVERAESFGADRVIDYTREDFTRTGDRYDVMFDNAGSKPWSVCKRVVVPDGTVVLVGGPMGNFVLGPMGRILKSKLGALVSRQKAPFFVAKFNKPDMLLLQQLLADGKITPMIGRRYAFADTADALRYMGEGHAEGKIVITL